MDKYLSEWSDDEVVLVVNSAVMTSKYFIMSHTLLEDIAIKAAETKNVVGIAICGDVSPVNLITLLLS